MDIFTDPPCARVCSGVTPKGEFDHRLPVLGLVARQSLWDGARQFSGWHPLLPLTDKPCYDQSFSMQTG